MTGILQDIIRCRIEDISDKKLSETELADRFCGRSDFRPFHEALCQSQRQPLNGSETGGRRAAVIAEIKRGSPSLGLFAPHLDLSEAAHDYETAGAACLSVLTEPRYFHGSLNDLIAARGFCNIPVLQKDFIVSAVQIREAALYADAILLIARCLERQQLADFYALAAEHRLDVLVEVFDEDDCEKIEGLHFPLIGINHRNLAAMTVDLDRSEKLAVRLEADQTLVAASGIRSRNDVERMMNIGIRTFLVGETLSRSANRIETLKSLIGGDRC
ncbi:MAG: indole-3-glycerol phosphate synthase TrpC [Planctomycetaceae bacterium]|jgi:indole-3-glycerol phosphate synthase|nr:indole-3-glycerol phosphate synthase TrpC [Planctomycetaceae bacterium]